VQQAEDKVKEEYWYQCDNCEDMEEIDYIVSDGWPCECGGIMERLKPDYYSEVGNIESCMICSNARSKKCSNCKRQ
jgi:hypothetical protein